MADKKSLSDLAELTREEAPAPAEAPAETAAEETPAPPPADDEPCDDGCCPMPDCDPGACRIAGSLMADVPPMLPALPPATYDVAFDAPAVPGAPLGHLLRPPIA